MKTREYHATQTIAHIILGLGAVAAICFPAP